MIFKNIKHKISIISKIIKDRDAILRENISNHECFPAGHFYSVIPNLIDIKNKENKIFNSKKNISGINLNENKQIKLFDKLSSFYKELNFPEKKQINRRYFYENPAYSYGDAIILYSIIRNFCPKNIIEIGSGFSSCVILDTNEKFFKNKINCIFIEPFSDLLKSLIKTKDKNKIIESNLQDIPKKYFKLLKKNDILFIDSTHVSKVGSDVNYLFFEIIPNLNPGVIIHFHDVFHPFEYPKELIYKGFFWNEDYILRAFLEFNNNYEILFFNDFFCKYHQKLVKQKTPLILKNSGGGIWLKKIK